MEREADDTRDTMSAAAGAAVGRKGGWAGTVTGREKVTPRAVERNNSIRYCTKQQQPEDPKL